MRFAYTVMAPSRAGLTTIGFETLRWAAKFDRLGPIAKCLPQSSGTISASGHGWGRQTVREQAARHWKTAEASKPLMTPVRLREVPCRSRDVELGGTTEKQACSDVIGAAVPQAAPGRTR